MALVYIHPNLLSSPNNSSLHPLPPLSMHLLRRKSLVLASESFTMKHVGSNVRKGSNLSVFIVIFFIFLFAMFMYNEDVKAIAEFPFSSKSTKAHQILTTTTTTPGPATITTLQSSDDGDMPKKEKKTKEADELEGIKLPELEVALLHASVHLCRQHVLKYVEPRR